MANSVSDVVPRVVTAAQKFGLTSVTPSLVTFVLECIAPKIPADNSTEEIGARLGLGICV